MLLVIDCGNTNTLFAIYNKQDKCIAQWRMGTDSQRTADEHIVWLSQLLSLQKLSVEQINGCVISTVVPQSLFHLKNLSRRYLNIEPLVIGDPEVELGICIQVKNKKEVGADRLVNAVGAQRVYKGALLIIDSGTATTFDIVSSDSEFVGGVIAPGINLSAQALHNAAAQLPRVAIHLPERVIGKNTNDAMASGIFWGYVCLIEGLIKKIKESCDEKLCVVATGGIVPLFENIVSGIDYYDTELTCRGLLEIWKRNRR